MLLTYKSVNKNYMSWNFYNKSKITYCHAELVSASDIDGI